MKTASNHHVWLVYQRMEEIETWKNLCLSMGLLQVHRNRHLFGGYLNLLHLLLFLCVCEHVSCIFHWGPCKYKEIEVNLLTAHTYCLLYWGCGFSINSAIWHTIYQWVVVPPPFVINTKAGTHVQELGPSFYEDSFNICFTAHHQRIHLS